MRLMLLAHGPTERARDLVFGDESAIAARQRHAVADVDHRMPRAWLCAPEPACVETARLAGGVEPELVLGLRGPDLAAWQGRSLAEVMASDPAGLQAWLTDTTAAPHGGESLAALAARVGCELDGRAWPHAGAAVVVTPLVVRAALVHALGAPARSVLHVDVAPLSVVRLSRERDTWRLSGLVPGGMRKGPE